MDKQEQLEFGQRAEAAVNTVMHYINSVSMTVLDQEDTIARLEAELERVTRERDGLGEAANDLLEGVEYDGQIHNETIERLRDAALAALSARQNGEGVGE